MRVWICQCLCGPNRHAIMAAAEELSSRPEAERLQRDLRRFVAELHRTGAMNPWCGICGSGAWTYELDRTPWRSMDEAKPHLNRAQYQNLLSKALFGSDGPRPRRH
jgi:hypothetical protein